MELNPQTDTLPTQGSLIGRLRDLDDSRAWTQFFELYEQRVKRIARCQGLNAQEAEEVAQEVFKRVARTICEFEFTARPGSFRRWLYQLTRWRATDQLRERTRAWPIQRDSILPDDSSNKTPAIERVPGPSQLESKFRDEASWHVVETLISLVKHLVEPRDLQIFQLLVLDEAKPAKVAELYGVSISNVYTIKHRVAAKLREEISRVQFTLK